MESQSDSTQTVSLLKLPMLKTRDYDLWSMRMEQYLTHTDYALWEVIVNGDAPAVASASTEGPIPPKTAEQKIARKNELKAKSTLLLAIPDEHLLKFHGIKDAKSLWEAIKTRFGGNKESKKMQKTILKQQYENFTASRSEGLDKIYDRFQKLISQLEIQGEVISQEDANLKLLRSLPPAWNNIALIMRNKPDLDELSMDDLYNNLKVYEAEIKSQSSSNSNSQNVAFVSSENTSSTNEAVNTALDVSTASTQGQASSSTYADDVMFSFFVNQSKSPLLDNEDMEQIDSDDLEEMDLKWQVAMLTMRIKRFMKKTRRNLNLNGKEAVGLDMTKVECYNYHKKGYFARDYRAPRNQGNRNGDNARRVVPVETSANALVVQDGIGGYDWSFQDEDGPTNFALMAYTSQGSSSSSSSNTKVHTCSKNYVKSFEALQKQYDQQREALSKSSLEIIGYQMGLESLEARIVVHEKNELVYEEKISFLNYDVQVKDISIKNLKNQLEEALKEKDDLKLKLEKFEESSKNLTKLINSQISVKDKTGLGFDSYVNESEVLDNVVDSHECDQVNDRFKKNDFVYKSKVSETITSVPNIETTVTKTSKDSLEKPKTVRPSTPIIEDWESDSEDENVFAPKEVKKTVKSGFEKIEFVNARNSTVEKPRNFSQNPRDNKRNRNGFEFTKKACFVCGSFNHLIKDCDFHDKNMVQKHVLNNVKKGTAVLTKSGIVPISTARQNSSRATTPVSAARPINTAAPKPFVNVARTRPKAFYKSHSTSRTPFNQQTALKNRNLNDRVNTAKVNSVNIAKVNSVNTAKGNKVTSAIGKQGINVVKSSSCWIWRPKQNVIDHISKDSGSYMPKRFDYVDPQDQGIFNSGCSRHMTGNKFYLSDYQDIDGGFVAFGGSSKGGRKPVLSFMRPFGCPVTILNTLDHLGTGPNWMFDIDTLTMSMNYQPVFVGNQTNGNAGTKENIDAGQAEMNTVPGPQYVLLPFLTSDSQSPKNTEDEVANDARKKNGVEDPAKEDDINGPREATNTNSTNRLNIVSSPVNVVSSSFTTMDPGRARDQRNEFESVFGQDKDANSTYRMLTPVSAAESSYENLGGSTPVNAATPSNADYSTDPLMPDLEDTADLQDTGIFGNAYEDEDMGAKADLNNLETTMNVSLIPTTIIHKDHAKEQIIGDINSATQTRRMIKMSEEHAIISYINKQMRTNDKDYQNYLFACFVSQMEPKKVIQALADSSWVEAMQEELNKKDERGIVIRNKARLVTQGYTQEEGIDYDEVFAPVARIVAIKLFLAYASFMGFIVYQIDVKSVFLYSIIEEEMSSMRELTFLLGLQVKQKDDGIFISQDKCVADILKKFDFSSVKTASTPLETNKALIKDEEAKDVDVHLYRSMIGSLMYLTASRPDIMFVVYACARFQVTLKTSHLHAVKRIFRYLKVQPKLGLWYPRDSPFDLEAFSDSDYARASLDRKSTIGGCQFLGKRLISWQFNSVKQIHAIIDGKAVVISESSVRSDLLFNDEDGDSPRRQETIRGAPAQTRSERVLEKPNEPPIPKGHASGSGKGSMEHTFELMDNVLNTPYDSSLSGGYTPRIDEGRMELIQELMETYTSLTKRVLVIEEAKTAQDRVITRLKLRVKRLEKKRKARTLQPMKRRLFKGKFVSSDDDLDGEDASKQGRTDDKTKPMFQDSEFDKLDDDMDKVEGETVNTATIGVSAVSAPVTTAGVAISTVEPRTPLITATTAFIDKYLTIAQTLVKMRSKGVLVEEEPEKPEKVKRMDQIEIDAQLAQRLHEEEIDVDHELAMRLTHEEQEKYTIEERARLLVEFFERRKTQMAAERAETIRNKPPTRTQVRNRMITYLKHMDNDSQQQAERTKKRPKADSKEESSKKQKLEEDNDLGKEELRDSMDVALRDDVAIDVESLATKYPIDVIDLHRTMPNTRSGASRTHEGINKQIDRRLAGALGARDAARNLEPLIGGGSEQEEISRNEVNGNEGNGNGVNENGVNGNGENGNGGNGYNPRGFVHVARECTYQDFLKCQPLSFNRTEGVVGLTRWFKKIEMVFHISNCPEKYQVKYVTCTLLNNALTWWNSYKWTIGIEAAYAMSWAELMKLMTKELVLLCTRMVPNEEDKVKRFVGGLPDNIQGNVIAGEPTKFQDAIRIANNLMDQKLKGYARSAKNKRRLENNLRDNHGQQPIFKWQNVRGQNVARAYTAGNNEKKGYVGSLPYCNKCKLHHAGPCTVRCGNCKRVGHITRDCKVTFTLNTQRVPVRNQPGIVCYECRRPGHFRKDCPKLRSQNRGNKTRNKNGNKIENHTGGNKATSRAYAIRGGGANPDSNIVTGTFLLNNCYASLLFDSGADRSFVLPTFSVLLDVAPSTLDTSDDYDGGSKSRLNIISCTKTQKYIQKGCQVYLAQVTSKKTEDKSEEKRLEDVTIVQEFLEIFPEDLPGLPPAR
ncbi:ribonuclease H-like domain-containing protein [Tanacetum coccineum]